MFSGKVITTQQDAECEQCINNNGMCYDTDGDDQKDGCQCKLSQTGEDCGTVHREYQRDMSLCECDITCRTSVNSALIHAPIYALFSVLFQ